jgi:hypothetical protein
MLSLFTLIFGLCRNASNNGFSGLFIQVQNGANAKLNVKGSVNINSNEVYGMQSYLPDSNSNLDFVVESDATLNFDQNEVGFGATVFAGAELNVDVKGNGSFESCGNTRDISGFVGAATATFSGAGYTCDQNKVVLTGTGTVVEPVCEPCA